MKFLSYNIQYEKDQDGKYNLYRMAQIIKEADVACIHNKCYHRYFITVQGT